MTKFALCMRAKHAPAEVLQTRGAYSRALLKNGIAGILAQSEIFLEDRATCETDPSLLQFLPYVVVKNSKGLIFNYSRGSGSEEARLLSKLSIGVGGHVDTLPDRGVSLENHLRMEAARELQEEINIRINPADVNLNIRMGLLVDSTNAVGQVHLGILCTYLLSENQDVVCESNVIEKGKFNSLADLKLPATYDRMENWSQLAIQDMYSASVGHVLLPMWKHPYDN